MEIVTSIQLSVVSIHAPREGCDYLVSQILLSLLLFQFTHPGRGATRSSPLSSSLLRCFNSRTPGGVRPKRSIPIVGLCEFQFTHPGRGATTADSYLCHSYSSFNSRTPGGVRLTCTDMLFATLRFQFTHPGRGATIQHLNR